MAEAESKDELISAKKRQKLVKEAVQQLFKKLKLTHKVPCDVKKRLPKDVVEKAVPGRGSRRANDAGDDGVKKRCFVCGLPPSAGVLLPTSVVLYFCDEHLPAGKKLAISAWENEREKQKLRLAKELWDEWYARVLKSWIPKSDGFYCELCGVARASKVMGYGDSVAYLCKQCAKQVGYH